MMNKEIHPSNEQSLNLISSMEVYKGSLNSTHQSIKQEIIQKTRFLRYNIYTLLNESRAEIVAGNSIYRNKIDIVPYTGSFQVAGAEYLFKEAIKSIITSSFKFRNARKVTLVAEPKYRVIYIKDDGNMVSAMLKKYFFDILLDAVVPDLDIFYAYQIIKDFYGTIDLVETNEENTVFKISLTRLCHISSSKAWFLK